MAPQLKFKLKNHLVRGRFGGGLGLITFLFALSALPDATAKILAIKKDNLKSDTVKPLAFGMKNPLYDSKSTPTGDINPKTKPFTQEKKKSLVEKFSEKAHDTKEALRKRTNAMSGKVTKHLQKAKESKRYVLEKTLKGAGKIVPDGRIKKAFKSQEMGQKLERLRQESQALYVEQKALEKSGGQLPADKEARYKKIQGEMAHIMSTQDALRRKEPLPERPQKAPPIPPSPEWDLRKEDKDALQDLKKSTQDLENRWTSSITNVSNA